ncbi:MAG: helix-turn-helix transcriptional regulator [Clostridiales bacterium]|jgi:hypothetical protein|nr:helix-turn-helix transcriptional regulator [Clostridiales bacterium]
MKELGKKIGVAESTISQYETGKREPDFETLLKLGEFFNVSVDYLLRGEQYHEKTPALTAKDERDISKKLEEALSQLESSQEGLMFQGEPLDDATKELIAISLRNSLEMGKRLAKQKFTPKKYKGEQ